MDYDGSSLPTYLNTARFTDETNPDNVNAADYEVAVDGNSFDLRDMIEQSYRYNSEQKRAYFARRYNEVLEKIYGVKGASAEYEKIPYFLGKDSHWISGSEHVNLSGDGFGQVVGRSLTAFRSNILPRRVFNDFGVVWIMMALRYPQIYTHEKYNYLDRVNPSYRGLINQRTDISANETHN